MEAQIKTVIDKLIAKTQAEEVNWRMSSAEDEFCLFLDHSTITIGLIRSFSIVTYVFRLYNELGEIATELEVNNDGNSEESVLLAQLYSEAKKSFRNEKQVLEMVMEELQKVGIVGNDENQLESVL